MTPSIDLNCDMGESFGIWRIGNDREVLEHVSSANIACGFHAGDPETILATTRAAVERGVAIGAHPGFPDLQGFGRRAMQLDPDELYASVVYQVGALQAIAKAAGGALHHVKAHGALYNMAARDRAMTLAICRAVRDLDPDLVFFGLAGSAMIGVAREAGLAVAEEVFADRSYQDDGSLTPRSQPGAMITDVEACVAQVLRMVREGVVRSVNGVDVPVRAHTLCIHGDQPGAVAFAQRIRAALADAGAQVRPAAGERG
jgi:UPF0271 protein